MVGLFTFVAGCISRMTGEGLVCKGKECTALEFILRSCLNGFLFNRSGCDGIVADCVCIECKLGVAPNMFFPDFLVCFVHVIDVDMGVGKRVQVYTILCRGMLHRIVGHGHLARVCSPS